MLAKVASFVVAILFALGLLSYISQSAYEKCVYAIGYAIATPIVVVFTSVGIVYGVLKYIYGVLKRLAGRLLKAGLFIGTALTLVVVIILTWPVRRIGKAGASVIGASTQIVRQNALKQEAAFARRSLVEIMGQDNREIEFDTIAEYKTAIEEAKQSGNAHLSLGEGILTIAVGTLLLISQYYRLNLFGSILFGIRAGYIVQALLLALAISVAYRILMLRLLSFTGEETFSTLSEADVALKLQRGVSHIGFIMMYMFLIALALSLARVSRELIRESLEMIHEDEYGILDILKNGYEETMP